MSDVLVAGPPAVTPIPAAQPNSPPPSPVNAPPVTPANEPVLVDKSPDTPVYYTDANGREVKATLAEAVAAHQRLQSVKIPDGFDAAKWDLYVRAHEKNDPAAIRQLMQTYFPETPAGTVPGQPAVPPPPSPSEQALLDRIAKMEAAINGRLTPLAEQQIEEKQLGQIDTILKNQQVAAKFPHLAKHPNAAQIVKGRLDTLVKPIANATPQQLQQCLTVAIQEWEAFLAQTAQLYGTPPQHPASRVNVLDDRGSNTAQWEKPRYTVLADGTVADNYAAPNAGSPTPAGQTIPNQHLLPPTGGAPGVDTGFNAEKPFTPDDLKGAMRARLSVLR